MKHFAGVARIPMHYFLPILAALALAACATVVEHVTMDVYCYRDTGGFNRTCPLTPDPRVESLAKSLRLPSTSALLYLYRDVWGDALDTVSVRIDDRYVHTYPYGFVVVELSAGAHKVQLASAPGAAAVTLDLRAGQPAFVDIQLDSASLWSGGERTYRVVAMDGEQGKKSIQKLRLVALNRFDDDRP